MVQHKMVKRKSLGVFGISPRSALLSLILVSNALTWYSLAFNILKETMTETSMILHFSGAIIAAIIGSKVIEKFLRRKNFLILWMVLGILSSLILMQPNSPNTIGAYLVSLLIGISFGLGLPASLGYFTDSTSVENRGRLGGLILIINGLGTFLLAMIPLSNVASVALILVVWRIAALIIFLVVNPPADRYSKQKGISFRSILSQRAFMMYVIPWLMFSLVNFLSIPIQAVILQDATKIETLVIVESALAGIVAVIAGFLSDVVGRKRITISGFVLLGIGYAILGISQGIFGVQGNMFVWYVYTVVDGIAWGIFSVIFIMTIWGDLSYGDRCEKYYALGGIPFFISNLLRLLLSPHIVRALSGIGKTTVAVAIFSFTAFFLFLAVLPLMFAPETLPEKKIRERELRKYVEAAKKAKKKYV